MRRQVRVVPISSSLLHTSLDLLDRPLSKSTRSTFRSNLVLSSRKTRRKLIARLPVTFLVWVVLLCSACGTDSKQTATAPQKAPASRQVFVDPEVGVADIATFDPGLSPDFASIAAIDMVFTGLVQLDAHQRVAP